MKNILISEPKIEKIKIYTRIFFGKDFVSFFIYSNIILYFIYMLSKIIDKYI